MRLSASVELDTKGFGAKDFLATGDSVFFGASFDYYNFKQNSKAVKGLQTEIGAYVGYKLHTIKSKLDFSMSSADAQIFGDPKSNINSDFSTNDGKTVSPSDKEKTAMTISWVNTLEF